MKFSRSFNLPKLLKIHYPVPPCRLAKWYRKRNAEPNRISQEDTKYRLSSHLFRDSFPAGFTLYLILDDVVIRECSIGHGREIQRKTNAYEAKQLVEKIPISEVSVL